MAFTKQQGREIKKLWKQSPLGLIPWKEFVDKENERKSIGLTSEEYIALLKFTKGMSFIEVDDILKSVGAQLAQNPDLAEIVDSGQPYKGNAHDFALGRMALDKKRLSPLITHNADVERQSPLSDLTDVIVSSHGLGHGDYWQLILDSRNKDWLDIGERMLIASNMQSKDAAQYLNISEEQAERYQLLSMNPSLSNHIQQQFMDAIENAPTNRLEQMYRNARDHRPNPKSKLILEKMLEGPIIDRDDATLKPKHLKKQPTQSQFRRPVRGAKAKDYNLNDDMANFLNYDDTPTEVIHPMGDNAPSEQGQLSDQHIASVEPNNDYETATRSTRSDSVVSELEAWNPEEQTNKAPAKTVKPPKPEPANNEENFNNLMDKWQRMDKDNRAQEVENTNRASNAKHKRVQTRTTGLLAAKKLELEQNGLPEINRDRVD